MYLIELSGRLESDVGHIGHGKILPIGNCVALNVIGNLFWP